MSVLCGSWAAYEVRCVARTAVCRRREGPVKQARCGREDLLRADASSVSCRVVLRCRDLLTMRRATVPTRLFLDFGTAYCKAATCKRGEPPVALPIGEAVRQGRGDRHMVRTALFVSQSGSVYFGEAAVDAAGSEGRRPYDEIKDILTGADSRSKLDEILCAEDNPTGEHLTKRDATTLFLAFFTQAALQAHGRHQEMRRSIAMPVFKKDKQSWVTKELAEGLANANMIALHFGNHLFRSISLGDALRVLREAKNAKRPQVVADPPTVAEPIAAVAGHLLHFEPDGSTSPGLMMVVDVGAGTTDIAMFAKGQVEGIVTVRHVKESKESLPWAGKAMDRAVIDHLVEKSNDENRLRVDLEREGMGEPIKEEIFRERAVTRYGISTSLDEYLRSEAMSQVQTEIQRGFEDVLLRVDRSFFVRTVAVRFSGGGHDLPFLKDLARRNTLGDPSVRIETANQRPQWQGHRKFVDLNREVGSKFHRMAVALGGAYYCAESHAWLRLDDEISSLGGQQGPTRPLVGN